MQNDQRLVPCGLCNWGTYFKRANLPYVTLDAERRPIWDRPFDVRNLRDPAIYRRVRDYTAIIKGRVAEGRGLLLWGQSGSGKTRMASEIGLAATLAGINTRMGTLVSILDEVKAGFDNNTADFVWKRFRDETDLLILDDLGAENRSSDWVPERVFDLFDNRIKKKRCMIITTKYDPATLGTRLSARDEMVGSSIVSRLRELCRFVEVKVRRDYREVINADEEW